jgi:YHS domain-containing protein
LGLLRILFFIALLYIVYRLITSPRKLKNQDTADNIGNRANLAPQDILVEDPICHTYVPKQQAFILEQGERIFYFCSKDCRNAFITKQKNT